METKVQKWGNSLGVRFPKVYAEETGINKGSKVELSIQDGKIIIEPIKEVDISLNALLSKVTVDNKHHEIDAGHIGKEQW